MKYLIYIFIPRKILVEIKKHSKKIFQKIFMNRNIDINKLPLDVRKEYLKLKVKFREKEVQNKAKNDFMSFVKCVWPDFIEGSHHRS